MPPPELIIYLEPSLNSTLHTQLSHYFTATTHTPFVGNEATRYPPHTTMVGFFNSPTPPTHTTTISAILDYIDTWHTHLQTLTSTIPDQQQQQQQQPTSPKTVINGFYRPNPSLLLIGITPSPYLLNLLQTLSQAFPDLGLRRKQINHLSLCYWDDDVQPASTTTTTTTIPDTLLAERVELTNQATRLAQEQIPMVNIPAGTTIENEGWDVVMYSIEGRNKASGLPYPLQEIKRWTLPSFV
ncbi:MAG: hypothetical protein JOS17DRAFT_769220 [Linnemannia elongata]|nr:MAG: hypothetical protein JOS17DRAFT_769220 [Linnemannia elongata]